MRSNMELQRSKLLKLLTVGLFAGYSIIAVTAFASENSVCQHQDINQSTNFCEQNARHSVLENNLKILTTFRQRNLEIIEEPTLREEDLIKTTDKTDYNPNTLKAEISKTLDFDVWPRPKILNRYFENAIASLDLKGKEDLKSCMSLESAALLPDDSIISANQLNAAISFSENKLLETEYSKSKLAQEHSLKTCKQLFTLILG